MEEELVKKETLGNGEILEIFDCSRKISEDAFLVKMKARITVPVREELFSREGAAWGSFQEIVNKVGPSVAFEYTGERNFIMNPDRETVFQALVDTFFENMVPYLSKPGFPEKLVLKRYKEAC
ncbi:MAG: hypothetical protein R6V54_01740 [Desulfobacteraceae bacterium]